MRTTKRQIITYMLVFALIVSCITVGTVSLTVEASTPVSVTYRTHVQSYGWQDWVSDGDMSGTQGQAKRLEGINIKVSGNKNLGIQYTTHVQNYGWMPWSRNGEMSGTSGESKRLEAIKIQLIGKDKDKYDVYYRVHAQSYGWLGWAKNGQASGTAGYGKRLEGIQIKIVAKGDTIDTNMNGIISKTTTPYVSINGTTDATVSGANTATVMYRTHVQSYGWQTWKKNGQLSGTTEDKRLEAIQIQLTNKSYTGGIKYQLHVQSIGWQDWVSDGAMGGTSGMAKRVEGIRIILTGNMAKYYDVVYRAYIENIGWQAWKKNGAMAGTSGKSLKLEGIQIKLVKKETTTDTTEETHTHKYTATVTKKATCTENGEKTYTCSCGKSYKETIKATGHNLTEHKAVAATCTKAGNTAYWSCSNCGKYFSDSNGKTEIAKNSWVVKATGHKYTSKITKEPTYTENGIRTYTCSVCNYSYQKSIDKLVDDTTEENTTEENTTEEDTTEEDTTEEDTTEEDTTEEDTTTEETIKSGYDIVKYKYTALEYDLGIVIQHGYTITHWYRRTTEHQVNGFEAVMYGRFASSYYDDKIEKVPDIIEFQENWTVLEKQQEFTEKIYWEKENGEKHYVNTTPEQYINSLPKKQYNKVDTETCHYRGGDLKIIDIIYNE